jgi:hypothetical protein
MENPFFNGVGIANIFFVVVLKEHFPVMLGKCEFLCKYVKYFSEIEISVFRNKTFSAQPKLVNPTSFLHILFNVTGKK